MLTYIARRVLYSIPVLIVSSFLSFTFVSLAGDPTANLRQNPKVSELTLHLLQHQYHLDQSIPVRYWYWLQDVFFHKLGTSLITSQPIWPDITRTIGHTAQVVLLAEVIALFLGVAIGIFSAVRQYSFFDYTFTSLSFVCLAMPVFWLGQQDVYAVMAYLMVTAIIIIVANLVADVLYGLLDPRIRHG